MGRAGPPPAAARPQAQILHLAYSAATICSLDSARIASQDRDYVTLLDTRLGSAALALVVEGVVRWLAENPDAGAVEAAEYARDLSARAHMAFIPGDLGYLRAGGRLSNAAFVGATLLRIRPVIEISEGRLVATRKLRGSMASCVSALIDHVAASCDAVLDRIAFIRSAGLPEQVQDLAERHARELGFHDVVWYDMLNAVTAHGGPGTFGARARGRLRSTRRSRRPRRARGPLGGLGEVLVGGMRALFGTDRLLRCAMLLSLGISMVMGSFQGIVLPAHFTAAGQPQMVGFVVSSMGAGLLAGSVLYTALSARLSRRAWFVGSMAGMLASVVALGSLPSPLALLGTAALVGLFAGPASSLLSFFAYDRVDPASLGTAMGTLNALYLVAAPAGAFVGSVLVGALGTDGAGAALSLGWAVACAAGLWSPARRRM